MAYIKVDYNKFEHAASAIDTYITRHKSNMGKIDAELSGLSSSWQGSDYLTVKKEWNQMNSNDSTSGQMLKSLKNYAEFLRSVGKSYKNAQNRAIDRANGLPRW